MRKGLQKQDRQDRVLWLHQIYGCRPSRKHYMSENSDWDLDSYDQNEMLKDHDSRIESLEKEMRQVKSLRDKPTSREKMLNIELEKVKSKNVGYLATITDLRKKLAESDNRLLDVESHRRQHVIESVVNEVKDYMANLKPTVDDAEIQTSSLSRLDRALEEYQKRTKDQFLSFMNKWTYCQAKADQKLQQVHLLKVMEEVRLQASSNTSNPTTVNTESPARSGGKKRRLHDVEDSNEDVLTTAKKDIPSVPEETASFEEEKDNMQE
ncbi:hypothetical protein PMAYCL1PPCAC_01361 [Pristionchus mayeri]|uniref:Uncharacterized protein n=1 Tax=Pristionchus mayeri TaxID=1317129 RepID=A0AAN4Z245_9BILA|nr:hypothetical protein PMAYCL1PPCAC_01361 [Pristionchus mayeri]